MNKDTEVAPINNGRNGKGQFAKGHSISRGPHKGGDGTKAKMLKAALLSAVSPKDIVEIARALVKKAKKGDVFAAREVLDRMVGKADENIQGEITITVQNYAGASGRVFKFAS